MKQFTKMGLRTRLIAIMLIVFFVFFIGGMPYVFQKYNAIKSNMLQHNASTLKLIFNSSIFILLQKQ